MRVMRLLLICALPWISTVAYAAGPVINKATAPTVVEGTANSFSGDLMSNVRITKGTQDGGEHIGATEGEGYQRVTPGVPLATTAGTAITTDTTSAAYTLPAGAKTPLAKITAAGAQTQTFTIYGAYDTTAANGISLCVITLSVAVKDVKTCDSGSQITKDFPYYYHVTSLTTGSASGELRFYNGLVGGSGSGGAGDASAANQTTMITALQIIDNIVSGSGVNVSQINGVTPLMGAGPTGTGSHRTTESNDSQLSADIALIKTAVQLIDDDQTGASNNYKTSAGTSEDETEIKATAGRLMGIQITNTNAAVRYFRCANLTAANTTPGTSTVFYGLAIPGATTGAGFTAPLPVSGIAFSTALTCWVVTGAADTDVAEVAANEIKWNIQYK